MKALTLTQPWATLVAIGAKKIETRSWTTSYRGPLAIHAGKSFPEDERLLCWETPFRRALEPTGLIDYTPYVDLSPDDDEHFDNLPRGGIVAVADLVAVVAITRDLDDVPVLGDGHVLFTDTPEYAFGNYDAGRWAWRLDNIRALATPIPARGYQNLWTPTPDVVAAIEAQR